MIMIEILGLENISIGFTVKFYTQMMVRFCSSSNSKICIFGGARGILGFIQGFLTMKTLSLDLS